MQFIFTVFKENLQNCIKFQKKILAYSCFVVAAVGRELVRGHDSN